MVRFFENHPLEFYNTFGVKASARYFFEFTEPEDLDAFVNANDSWKDLPVLVLGGGSNVLFRTDFNGLILHPNIPGINQINETRQNVWIEAGAGEVWDDFVKYCVGYQLGGVENLSLIPGLVGAAPVQNIGAYGQEVSEVIELVKGYDLEHKTMVEYPAGACAFSYRDSLFKRQLKNRFVITSVQFKLEKFPEFKLNYGQVEEKVKALGGLNLHHVRQAIIGIRESKLPDVRVLGNAGSFFKNPVIEIQKAEAIRKQYPEVPVYHADAHNVKIAAGWLIEKSGWKGYREGNVGVHEKQSLVLVNYGGATGNEIFEFSEKVRQVVYKNFGIELEREVNCI